MPPRPRRLDAAIPIERFALALRALHRDAGKPKQQLLAAAMHCSHATVSAILNAHRFPSWEQTEAFVRACQGDDVDAWRSRWVGADREINSEVPPHESGKALLELPSRSVQYISGRDHYAALVAQVRRARHRILATYVRVTPPLYLGFTDQETAEAASEYFAEVLAWAASPGSRSVRRIICLPNNEMTEWARQLHANTEALTSFEIRVLDWHISADTINIAVFDDTAAFLTFAPGTSPEMSGFQIDDRDFVREASGYFGRLWSRSTRLSDHLASGGR